MQAGTHILHAIRQGLFSSLSLLLLHSTKQLSRGTTLWQVGAAVLLCTSELWLTLQHGVVAGNSTIEEGL